MTATSARVTQRESSQRKQSPAIPADRVAVLDRLETDLMAISARTRAGLRLAAAAVHPELPPFGILLLRNLEQCGASTAGALATRLEVDKSVISRQTKQLEQLGFVKVTTSSADRRNRVITLTRKANARLEVLDPGGAIRLEARLHDWSTSDLRRLAVYLERLMAAAENLPLGFNLEDE
jgi:DNA-binding MarR family transcriptional regulator